MSTPVRVGAFAVAVLAAFGLALGLGRWVGPVATEPVAHSDAGDHTGDDAGDTAGAPAAGHEEAAHADGGHDDGGHDVSGLSARADGFALELAERELPAGKGATLSFTVRTSSGRPLLDYQREHEKDLHLIVVRRDLVGFQHVHPVLDRETGLWTTRVDLTPGTWRVIADFLPEGWEGVTLADDLAVGGDFSPARPGSDRRTDVVDGYEVTLTGDTAPGVDTELTTTVTRGGEPVTDLQPYLGAQGHLVALREGDLGYLHVHPEEGGGPDGADGAGVRFATAFPTAGTYRLFLDFKHGDVVRTADFTVLAGGAPGNATGGDSGGGDGHGHEEDDHDH